MERIDGPTPVVLDDMSNEVSFDGGVIIENSAPYSSRRTCSTRDASAGTYHLMPVTLQYSGTCSTRISLPNSRERCITKTTTGCTRATSKLRENSTPSYCSVLHRTRTIVFNSEPLTFPSEFKVVYATIGGEKDRSVYHIPTSTREFHRREIGHGSGSRRCRFGAQGPIRQF